MVSLAIQAVAFIAIARWVPTLDPADSAQETANHFAEHHDRIRAGLILFMMATALMALWAAAIAVQLKRVEGPHSVFTWAWIMVSGLFVVEVIFILFFWMTATFRPERDAEIIQVFNDMGWIPWIGMTSTLILEAVILGIVMLLDRRSQPLFPRWAGYFNLWAALLFSPGSLTVYFTDGPLAWNGLIAFYIPFCTYAIWIPVNTYVLLRAIKQHESESVPPSTQAADERRDPRVDMLTLEVEALRKELIASRKLA